MVTEKGINMLGRLEISKRCSKCGGVGLRNEQKGEVQSTQNPCLACGGLGYQESFFLTLPSGYFYATDVFNCIDFDEYDVLAVKQREAVRVILSIGVCNLNQGSKQRDLLTQIFGEGTQTRLNLIELVS